MYRGRSIPNQQRKYTPSDFFESLHACWVRRETKPDQNLAYFDCLPQRYEWSIFEAIIYTSSFKHCMFQCRALQFDLLNCFINCLSDDLYIFIINSKEGSNHIKRLIFFNLYLLIKGYLEPFKIFCLYSYKICLYML